MFESRISAVRVGNLPFPQNIRISSWSYDMAGHAKKCVERYCELANKTTPQLCKVSTPCIVDHHFKKKKKQNLLENCHKYALWGYHRVVFQSDNEPSILGLPPAVKLAWTGDVVQETSAEGCKVVVDDITSHNFASILGDSGMGSTYGPVCSVTEVAA